MNYYGQQIPNSGLISLDELHLQMLVRVLGTGARRKLSFRKIGTSLHDLVVQLAAGLVHSFGSAGGSIPSASCGWVFPLVGQQDFFSGLELWRRSPQPDFGSLPRFSFTTGRTT